MEYLIYAILIAFFSTAPGLYHYLRKRDKEILGYSIILNLVCFAFGFIGAGIYLLLAVGMIALANDKD